MKIQLLTVAYVASVVGLPNLTQAADAIRLDMLQGAKEISISRGAAHLIVKEGDTLQPKDELTTGPKESVRIIFPDRTQLWVGSSTSIQINNGATPDGHQIGLVQMKEGSTRVLVPKTYGTTKRIKFVVKTPAATMGVRGTDFVVDSSDAGKNVELHTLEGVVDATQSIKALIKKDVVPVERGFMIQAEAGKGIPQPSTFNISNFTSELNQRQPAFITYSATPIKQPAPEAQGASSSGSQTSPSTSPGIKGKIENMMKAREGQIDKQSR